MLSTKPDKKPQDFKIDGISFAKKLVGFFSNSLFLNIKAGKPCAIVYIFRVYFDTSITFLSRA